MLEVHTPVLGPHTVTDAMIDSLAVPDLGYLQTSPEYFQKRLLAAGAPSLYQLGPVFRAGERGRAHRVEFTMLEWYRLGFDDVALRAEVAALVDRVLGPADYRTMTYAELLAGQQFHDRAEQDLAFDKAAKEIRGRVFVTHYPAAQAALARLHDDGRTAARFELVVDGLELANGYHELEDAGELTARFAHDNDERTALGKPPVRLDTEFLAAMDAGMPDCAGVALGLERLLMLKLDTRNIADVIAFA